MLYKLNTYVKYIYLFCLFIQFLRFSQQEYSSGLPFPLPVDHVCQNSPL